MQKTANSQEALFDSSVLYDRGPPFKSLASRDIPFLIVSRQGVCSREFPESATYQKCPHSLLLHIRRKCLRESTWMRYPKNIRDGCERVRAGSEERQDASIFDENSRRAVRRCKDRDPLLASLSTAKVCSKNRSKLNSPIAEKYARKQRARHRKGKKMPKGETGRSGRRAG